MSEPKKEPAIISRYRIFNKNYSRKQMLGEVINLLGSNGYEDFLFIASGPEGTATRIGSDDKDLRWGDLLWMVEKAKGKLLSDDD